MENMGYTILAHFLFVNNEFEGIRRNIKMFSKCIGDIILSMMDFNCRRDRNKDEIKIDN